MARTKSPKKSAYPFPAPHGFLKTCWRRMTLGPRQRLLVAVAEHSLVAVNEALLAGADPNLARFDDGSPVLHAACQTGWLGGIERLLDAGASAAIRTPDGRSVVHLVAPHGFALAVRMVAAGAPLGDEAELNAIEETMNFSDQRSWKVWARDARLKQAIPEGAPVARIRM